MHNGVDPVRVIGAAVHDLVSYSAEQGASTITQQLARLSFLTPDKTIRRKVQELFLAGRLERTFDKSERHARIETTLGVESRKELLEAVLAQDDIFDRHLDVLELDLGQVSEGEEKARHLQTAIDKHADCMYGDGVQVGAYARYLLGLYYKEKGDNTRANSLFGSAGTATPAV